MSSDWDEDPTMMEPDGSAKGRARAQVPPATSPLPETGTLFANRYRIVNRLGQGGVGTVFRAEDVELHSDIAIKFLNEDAVADTALVEVLRNEVRTARLVTHPNVCRVHDLGVVDGRTFLTMEFVEGEDLGSLLRRIGRFPSAKALQVATQVGSGLLAAHERGIVHRDLKPGNVMIDADGDVRLTDFGLAGHVRGFGADLRISGTPAYMAPELFRGETPSTQSDIYAFGALLYELLSGSRAFEGASIEDLRRAHEAPIRPSLAGRVRDLDPQIEAVLARCLSVDPKRRPRSMVEVLAGLPGWDPIRESLSRGETPSPITVASARGSGELAPERATWVILLVSALVFGTFALVSHQGIVARTELPLSGAVLAEDARRILDQLGYERAGPSEKQYEVWAFDFYEELIEHLSRSEDPDRWQALEDPRTSAIDFYYRRSPRPIAPSPGTLHLGWDEPPIRAEGMVQVRLSPRGELLELVSVPTAFTPKPFDQAPEPSGSVMPDDFDWSAVFDLAGLPFGEFDQVAPELRPVVDVDQRWAFRDRTATEDAGLQVEAGLRDSQLASFRVIDRSRISTSLPSDLEAREVAVQKTSNVLFNWFGLVMYLGTIPFAWSSIAKRRVDVRAANRCALFMFALVAGATYLMADHSSDLPAELQILSGALSRGLIKGTLFWLLYAGYEPYVRRIWPELLVSWSRLFQRRFSDRLVWSNTVVGIGVGACMALLEMSYGLLAKVLEIPGPPPVGQDFVTAAALDGPMPSIGAMFHVAFRYFGFGMMTLMALVMIRLLIRNKRLSYAVALLLFAGLFATASRVAVLYALPIALLQATLNTWGLVRHGLLGLACGTATFGILLAVPSTLHIDRWYAGSGLLALGGITITLIICWRVLRRP